MKMTFEEDFPSMRKREYDIKFTMYDDEDIQKH